MSELKMLALDMNASQMGNAVSISSLVQKWEKHSLEQQLSSND